MTRNNRQNKILELINLREIETQEELVEILKSLDYDVTQATVSRDIKELGLVKILTDSKKYKYAKASDKQMLSIKTIDTVHELILDFLVTSNFLSVKVVEGTVNYVAKAIKECNIVEIFGMTYGDDTILIITQSQRCAELVKEKIIKMFNL